MLDDKENETSESDPLSACSRNKEDCSQSDAFETTDADDAPTPIEMQCEQVDMNDPKMDVLEWTVRKIIPIPAAYYWETGNYDIPTRTKMWHRSVGFLGSLVRLTDRVGAPIVNATGLNASRYDYFTSSMTERQLEKARNTASERKQRNQARREATNAEEGGSSGLGLQT
jgi:hypothetical protein